MVYKYEWGAGYCIPVKAEIAGKEIERIEKEYGGVTKELLLESARKESSPLHSAFEWDDTVAAEKYRLQQSGYILRAIVKTEIKEEQPKSFRAFVNINPNPSEKANYINTIKALSAEDTRKIVLGKAIAELDAFKNKYSTLNELSTVFIAIDKAKEELDVRN